SAIEAPLPMLPGARGKLYVLRQDASAVRSGRKVPEPLVLRVNVDDCMVIHLTNETAGSVSFDAAMLAHDPLDRIVTGPAQRRSYPSSADHGLGEAPVLLRDSANVMEIPRLGLSAAIIVGPRGAKYRNPATGEDMSTKAGWRADVIPATGRPYRDFVLLL